MMLLVFLATLIIALLAQWHLKRAYTRYSRTPTASGFTGAEVAAQILRQSNIANVDIVEHEELLGDHYNPIHKRLVLSRANYHGTSEAALEEDRLRARQIEQSTQVPSRVCTQCHFAQWRWKSGAAANRSSEGTLDAPLPSLSRTVPRSL